LEEGFAIFLADYAANDRHEPALLFNLEANIKALQYHDPISTDEDFAVASAIG